MRPTQTGIYAITNTNNGKQYVGSAVNILKRWNVHRHHLRAGTHSNRYLQHAWNKHGEPAFTFTILEECAREHLLEREQHYIDTLEVIQRGYNRVPQAGSQLGLRLTSEQCANYADRQRRLWQDPAYRANFIARAQAVYDIARREQVAAQVRQYWQDPAYRENWLAKMRVWTQDPVNRARNAETKRRQWADPETRARFIAAQKAGKANSATRQRMSDLSRARWADPEYRARIIAAQNAGRDNPAHRQRLSEAACARWADPEWRAKAVAIRRARKPRTPPAE